MTFGHWKQDWFQIRNKEKYIGNNKPFYRSSWELKFMNFCDLNCSVIAWSSEKIIIPYRLPKEIDGTGKLRRYIVDFYCEIKDTNGNINKYLVEVKPKSQSVPPPSPKKMTKSYKLKALTFMINHFKWEAAQSFCNSKGYKWLVFTEEELYNIKI